MYSEYKQVVKQRLKCVTFQKLSRKWVAEAAPKKV